MLMSKTLLAACCVALMAGAAQAAHPLITDDTGTQGKGRHQLEVNTDAMRSRDGNSRVGAVTYSFGLRDQLDVFANLPVALSAPRGRGDVSLGMKWRFAEFGDTSLGLKPEVLLPSGDENDGLGNGKASAAITLVASHAAGPWTLHANLALAENRYRLLADQMANQRRLWRVSAAAWYALDPHWRLVGDVGVVRGVDRVRRGTPGFALAGVIYSPSEDIDLDAGLRFGLGCSDCPEQIRRQFGVGLTWRF